MTDKDKMIDKDRVTGENKLTERDKLTEYINSSVIGNNATFLRWIAC